MRLLHLALGFASFASPSLACIASSRAASDYVIVGAGPAGYVLATRLSEDPAVTVTLLEAGPDGGNDPNVYTPGLAGRLQGSQYTWNYTSQPDPRRGNRAIRFPQGHLLGGGTSVNFMSYSRGAASIYDEWAAESRNDGLRWGSLLEKFELSTNLTVPYPLDYEVAPNSSVYGHGPLQISYEEKKTDTEPFWGDAMAAAISPKVNLIDPTDGHSIGRTNGGPHTIDVRTGRRSSAQATFDGILSTRSNVKILTGAEATKINIRDGQARSVQYFLHEQNTTQTIRARIEIIISAGAIGSPKLLLLSGLGPQDHLQDLGIPVIKNIPEVGDNLHEHYNAVIMSQISEDVVTSYKLQTNATLMAEAQAQYTADGTGPLAHTLTSSYVSERPSDEFLDSINASFHKALPKDRPLLFYQYTTTPMVPNPLNANVITGFVSLFQPESHGQVRLASTDFRDSPLIFANYWGSGADLALELYGYKKLRQAMASENLAPIVQRELYPGTEVQSDEDLLQAMFAGAWPFHHPSGTCSLGKVVGPDFRIPGIGGLRVVDSSVLPYQPTSHLSGPVYAVSELAAQMIRENWS